MLPDLNNQQDKGKDGNSPGKGDDSRKSRNNTIAASPFLWLCIAVAALIGTAISAIVTDGQVQSSGNGAQTSGSSDHHRGGPPDHGSGPGRMPLHFLDLTDAQKAQIKTIHETEQARLEPVLKQLDETRRALKEATVKGQFNESQVRTLAATEAQATIELTVARARTRAAVYQVLTAEQRARLDKAEADHQNHKTEGRGRRH